MARIIDWFFRSPITILCFMAIIAFFLFLDLFHLSIFRGRVNWEVFGNVATWFAVFLNFAAVSVALIAILRQKEQFDKSLLLKAGERHSRVFAWIEKMKDPLGRMQSHLQLSNLTDAPIFIWEVDVVDAKGQSLGLKIGSSEFGLLPPGRRQHTLSGDIFSELAGMDGVVRMVFRFEDVAGVLRQRSPDGTLREVVQ